MTTVSIFEVSAKNERWIVLAALTLVAVLGLFATFWLGDMLMMSSIDGLAYALLLFFMWWAMMMAMMLPSAAPAILTYAAVNRKMPEKGTPVAVFAAGYAAVWTGFSIGAVALQVLFSEKIALSMMMAVSSAVVGGSLLIAAGLYQMSPLKYACLRKCQTPLMIFARHWQIGAFRMGMSHGIYCVGCCWVLMGLLFYGGVMELRWIVGLALYVAAEKMIPAGSQLSRTTGVILIAWGIWTITQAVTQPCCAA
jgi:predicted metal-binding membrane protein